MKIREAANSAGTVVGATLLRRGPLRQVRAPSPAHNR